MIDLELPVAELTSVTTMHWPNVPTWRYQGDRAAADLAYCVRFGTSQAPEPLMARGDTLAYELPATVPG